MAAAKRHPAALSRYRVRKPWGWELWLEVNERYALKEIFLRAGRRSSLQYHRKKTETLYVLSGRADFLLEDAAGVLRRRRLGPGGGLTILPRRRHRITAATDCRILEASTVELDDVVRLADDSGRSSGRLEGEHP